MTPIIPATLITPPDLGLVRLRAPGIAALKRSEQLQALALALHRDLSIPTINLRIATKLIADKPLQDEWIVAYTTLSLNTHPEVATPWLDAVVASHSLYWVGAPTGYVIGKQGASAVESLTQHPDELPQEVAAAIAGDVTITQIVLIDANASISEQQCAFWQAASGIEIHDGALPTHAATPLLPVPSCPAQQPIGPLDRSLIAATLLSIACLVFAGIAYFNASNRLATVSAETTVAPVRNISSGELLSHITLAAPNIASQLQNAQYASGSWVITLTSNLSAPDLQHMVQALENNGFSVQSTPPPNPRLRISLPR